MPPDNLNEHLDIKTLKTSRSCISTAQNKQPKITAPERAAFIGELNCKTLLGKDWQHNPLNLVHRLNFARAAKTN